MIKGCCMTCGFVMEGNTRALTDAQFTLHCDEKHRVKFRNGKVLAMKFFEGEAPKIERKTTKKRESGYLSEARQKELEATAVWI